MADEKNGIDEVKYQALSGILNLALESNASLEYAFWSMLNLGQLNGALAPAGGTTGQVLAKNSDTDYDLEWITAGGGAGTWGSITGTLSSQLDLQSALDGKANSLGVDDNYVTDAEKVKLSNLSGTNTGDQTSIVGITGTKAQFDTAVTDGNIMYIGDAPTAHTHAQADVTNLVSDLAAKQATLVSATNIKTINGTTILGSGDLTVSGGSGLTNGVIQVMRFGATTL